MRKEITTCKGVHSGVLLIQHSFLHDASASYEERAAEERMELNKIKAEGYDGVVLNVAPWHNYLRNDEEWHLLKERAEVCRQLGLRMWIYDEEGYPSGAAGTQTLSENADFESRAVVAVHRIIKEGDEWFVDLPRGHEKPISAFAYVMEGEKITPEELNAEPLRIPYENNGFMFQNSSDRNLLCICFFEKKVYEGAHCHHNVCASRRYVDIGNKEAIDAFFRNTYQKYIDVLQEYIEDGTMEAFFTDEPSYMGFYINEGLYPEKVIHPYDDLLPLYPMVNWSSGLEERFFEVFGYKIEEYLPALFLAGGRKFRSVRKDFYSILTMLAEEGYYANLGNSSETHGTRFSGHVLLEEKISDHPRCEGNFFDLLKHMHIPGMDMLSSHPETVWNMAFTPLVVKSISEIYRDGHVMDEVSAHNEAGNVSTEEIFVSLAMQYCFGADVFTSYYDNLLLMQTLGGETILSAIKKIQSEFPKREIVKVVLHYPIEMIMSETKPLLGDVEYEDVCRKRVLNCENNMEDCMYALLNNQVSFLFSDTKSLCRMYDKVPEFLVIPPQSPNETLFKEIKIFSKAGCMVIVVKDEDVFAKEWEEVADFCVFIDGPKKLQEVIRNTGLVKTSGNTKGIASLWGENKLLLVNSDSFAKEIVIDFPIRYAKDCFRNTAIPFFVSEQNTSICIPPYGVVEVGRPYKKEEGK